MLRETPCWQQDDPDRIVVWRPASPPRAIEGPLTLECFDGNTLVLELAPEQIACREDRGCLQQVLLGALHRFEIGKSREQTPPSSRIIFLRSDAPLVLRWTGAAGLILNPAADGTRGSAGSRSGDTAQGLRLPLRGICRLHLADPMLFYRSALQGLNRPSEENLLGVLDALVRTHLASHLEPLAGGGVLDRLHAQTLLADLGPDDLGEDLEALGLACLHLAAYLPLDIEEPVPAHATVPSLAGSYDDLL